MKCTTLCIQVASILGLLSYTNGQYRPAPRPTNAESTVGIVDSVPAATDEDSLSSGTGFAGAVQSGSKYFQYAHVPSKDHYEHGHKRGNEHHFIERHEKAQPHEGEFKTKVRWGDKHGGYGEHYWDYNHAGHGGDGDGEETQQDEQYVAYEGTEKPDLAPNHRYHRGVPEGIALGQQQEQKAINNKSRQRRGIRGDVEFIDEDSKSKILNGFANRHGGNYRRLPGLERNRRQHNFDY